MERPSRPRDLIIPASVGRHLSFAPVAFAVTEGPGHRLVYANMLFRHLQSAGQISIGPHTAGEPASAADLAPLLDRVLRSATTVRDTILEPLDRRARAWSCTVWPVAGSPKIPERLVIEVRDVEMIEDAKDRQRAIAEQLLLSALRDQDVAREAVDASGRADYLAQASRDLSMSLDENATRDTMRRLALPRPGTWCIVDVVESNGALHRLAAVHPDPAKQALARTLEEQWPSENSAAIGTASIARSARPTVVTNESGAALTLAAHGPAHLRILREIGFGSMLVVPLIVRARLQGAITFVSREGDPPFTAEEIALAVDLAARCALALDNARLYREADALRLVAETANRLKGQFLGSVSHELRTPLNAIGGFAELLDIGIHGPVTEQQRTALARIKANQQHLLILITEILDFVRVESGRMEYRNSAVSLTHALADVAGMLSGAITGKGLTLDGPRGEANAVAWADPNRVRQILVNLVMNAVKYVPAGTITLTCAVASDTVVAHVADTGPGIPAETLDSIFEPFIQLTAGLTDRRGGVGLGLAISRDLARGMNGDLTVESTLGAGSRFTLTLPLAGSGPTKARAAVAGPRRMDSPASYSADSSTMRRTEIDGG
jgi:signal transduction histidine kinase